MGRIAFTYISGTQRNSRADRFCKPIAAACNRTTIPTAATMRRVWPRRVMLPEIMQANPTRVKARAESGDMKRLWPSTMNFP